MCPHTEWNLWVFCWCELFRARMPTLPRLSLALSLSRILLLRVFLDSDYVFYDVTFQNLDGGSFVSLARSVFIYILMLPSGSLVQFQTLRLLLSCSGRCTRSCWMLILFSILIALCGFTPMAMINLNYVSIFFSLVSLSYFKNSLSPFIRNELVFVYIGCAVEFVDLSLTNSKSMMI